MSLPSQSSRGASRQSGSVHTRRRQVSPAKRALPLIVIAMLIALVWFFFLKPTPVNANQPIADGDESAGSVDQPIEIANNNTSGSNPGSIPSRALPNSGRDPDPDEEVDRVISNPALSRPNNPSSTGSLLDNAAMQGEIPGNTETQVPVENRPQPIVSSDPSRIRLQLDTARRLIAENDRVAARSLLSQTLRNTSLTESEADVVRAELTEINEDLVFGPIVAPGDPMCEEYRVQSGDSLSRIAGRRELATHWKLIQRVNRISNPSRIRLGQRLKLVRGPFHAVVHKREHRMDIYHGSPDDQSSWIYIRSFRVGLGTDNGTPLGRFVVNDTKLENPGWVNPRDPSERYDPNDPNNPIGEFWIGIDGLGNDASKTGYGIHGTVERESIGQNMSMGCVRLSDEDIAVVYELLGMHVSRVEIRP